MVTSDESNILKIKLFFSYSSGPTIQLINSQVFTELLIIYWAPVEPNGNSERDIDTHTEKLYISHTHTHTLQFVFQNNHSNFLKQEE